VRVQRVGEEGAAQRGELKVELAPDATHRDIAAPGFLDVKDEAPFLRIETGSSLTRVDVAKAL